MYDLEHTAVTRSARKKLDERDWKDFQPREEMNREELKDDMAEALGVEQLLARKQK